MKAKLGLLILGTICLCGCQTYHYRIVQPSTAPAVVGTRPAVIRQEPLEYRVSQDEGRVKLRIINPTAERVILLGGRSYVVDPAGESHPVRGRVLGPHSYVQLLLPPIPFKFAHPDYTWGWGWDAGNWGWGWPDYAPMAGPYYSEGFFGPPPIVYSRALTAYEWKWKQGPVQLHLAYERGAASFEHDFKFDREPGNGHPPG